MTRQKTEHRLQTWTKGLLLTASAMAVTLTMAGMLSAAKGPAAGLQAVEDYKFTALESEIAGIHPHPSNDRLFFVAANKTPIYRAGQKPVLAAKYRGKLLTIDRHSGEVMNAFALTGGQYGGIAYADQHLYVANLEPPQLLKVNPVSGAIVDRIHVAGPVGGLEYDSARGALIAQLYVGYPHLAVIDLKTRTTSEVLWSDESAMDLAKVRGDWLCTWTSGVGPTAFSEMRLLNQQTGRVKGRVRLNGVHTSMASLNPAVAGADGFISMVTEDRNNGIVKIRKHLYQSEAMQWQ